MLGAAPELPGRCHLPQEPPLAPAQQPNAPLRASHCLTGAPHCARAEGSDPAARVGKNDRLRSRGIGRSGAEEGGRLLSGSELIGSLPRGRGRGARGRDWAVRGSPRGVESASGCPQGIEALHPFDV